MNKWLVAVTLMTAVIARTQADDPAPAAPEAASAPQSPPVNAPTVTYELGAGG